MHAFGETYRQLALNIAYYRKKKGLTQLQLAEKAGISRTRLSNMEALNVPTPFFTTTLFRFAEALGVELSDLFDFKK